MKERKWGKKKGSEKTLVEKMKDWEGKKDKHCDCCLMDSSKAALGFFSVSTAFVCFLEGRVISDDKRLEEKKKSKKERQKKKRERVVQSAFKKDKT